MNSAWKTWECLGYRRSLCFGGVHYTWPQAGRWRRLSGNLAWHRNPQPLMHRFGPGVLVQVGGQTLLFDCGRGVTQRLFQLGVKLGAGQSALHHAPPFRSYRWHPTFWLTGCWKCPLPAQGAFQVFGPREPRTLKIEKA